MSPKKRIALIVIGLVILIVVFRAGQKIFFAKKSAGDIESKVPVYVAKVERKTVDEVLEITGDIRGLNEARVFPKVPGRLQRKVKEIGDSVKKGEVVALIDRDEPALKFAAAEVTSPLSGVLTRFFLDLGQNVTVATPICEVAEVSPLKIVINITEREFPSVKIGLKAAFTCDAYPKETFTGIVKKMSDALDPASRSAEVEIEAQNPGQRLKPGMFARVKLALGSHPNALVIPREALAEIGESRYAFIAEDGIARRREIKVGLKLEKEAEILSGLNEGEDVITVGWYNLTEGTPIEVVKK